MSRTARADGLTPGGFGCERTYVTEIWCPEPDDGVLRLFSPMKEPEPEAEAGLEADYDAEAAEYDVEPEASL